MPKSEDAYQRADRCKPVSCECLHRACIDLCPRAGSRRTNLCLLGAGSQMHCRCTCQDWVLTTAGNDAVHTAAGDARTLTTAAAGTATSQQPRRPSTCSQLSTTGYYLGTVLSTFNNSQAPNKQEWWPEECAKVCAVTDGCVYATLETQYLRFACHFPFL